MVDVSNTTVNSDFFVDDVKTVITAIKESKKRPDTKAIWQYLSNKLTSNIDEDYTGGILKAKGDSYEIVSESQKTRNRYWM